MTYFLLPLLVFIAVIVVAGFNKLYSMDAKIDKLLSVTDNSLNDYMHGFLIASGWEFIKGKGWFKNSKIGISLKDAYSKEINNRH